MKILILDKFRFIPIENINIVFKADIPFTSLNVNMIENRISVGFNYEGETRLDVKYASAEIRDEVYNDLIKFLSSRFSFKQTFRL